MSSKLIIILLCCLTVSIFSCSEKNYNGEDMINYPDMVSLLDKEVDMVAPHLYTHIHQEGEQTDSSQIGAVEIPWDEIKKIFADANLQKEELNFKYSIDVLIDTTTNSRTLYYKALSPKVMTKSLSIVSATFDSDIQNIYFETADDGFWSSEFIRVLLIPEDVIQIQKRTKGIFSKEKTVIDSYYYP